MLELPQPHRAPGTRLASGADQDWQQPRRYESWATRPPACPHRDATCSRVRRQPGRFHAPALCMHCRLDAGVPA
jgi:hypothetical protein